MSLLNEYSMLEARLYLAFASLILSIWLIIGSMCVSRHTPWISPVGWHGSDFYQRVCRHDPNLLLLL